MPLWTVILLDIAIIWFFFGNNVVRLLQTRRQKARAELKALAAHLRRFGKPVTVCESIPEGVETASALAGEDGVACAVGSLYMAGAVRACFGMY